MEPTSKQFPYPRFVWRRRFGRFVAQALLKGLATLQLEGLHHLQTDEPLLIVPNHFHFADTATLIAALPVHLEFLGGHRMPNVPQIVTFLPKIYGYYPVFRGTGSRSAIKAAQAVMRQNGKLVIFPEGGNWATVLRPARPGAAFIAATTGVRLVPVGLDGITEVFSLLQTGKRAKLTVKIGEPFGPFKVKGRGKERREQLDAIGDQMMREIAKLLPRERRGHFSADPAIRAAAAGTEVYPWAELNEEELIKESELNWFSC